MSTLAISFKMLDLPLSQKHISIAAKKSAQEAMRCGFGRLLQNTGPVTTHTTNSQGLWDRK
ncbi:MAG: hypothetical protein KF770_27980 [Anaerolineae bacterium]|nr:hypothetical protein [Anaerolineae bacterium]